MVIGVGIRTSPPLAALANGTLASATNCTDTSLTWNIGHPTETILPAILALGEKYQASGKDLLTSYIVGFEVGSRIGTGFEKHFELGWHTTATVGTFASTAAASKILKLDHQKFIMALGIAGSEISGLQTNRRSVTRALHSGLASRNGVVAASLALRGMEASSSIFEGRIGLTKLVDGGDGTSLKKAVDELGCSFDIIAPDGLCLSFRKEVKYELARNFL